MPFELIVVSLNSTNPDIEDPLLIGGYVATIPSGKFVDCTIVIDDAPDQPGTFAINTGFNNTTLLAEIGRWSGVIHAPFGAFVKPEPDASAPGGVVSAQSTPRTFLTNTDAEVFLQFTPDSTPPTYFGLRVILKVYS